MSMRLVLAAVLGSLGVVAGHAEEASGPTPAALSSPFGIHGPTYSHWLADGVPDAWRQGDLHLTLLRDSGAGWARQDFWWGLVEPEPGRFVWDDFDRAVASYERHGVRLFAILCYGSAWDGGQAPQTDEQRAQFANYVYEFVKRYEGRIAAFEIWNEPNIQPFWTPTPDPVLYTKLLRAAYAAAKRADPDCVVVGGAFAGPDHAFLRRMYEAGAAGSFDALSYHNYGQYLELREEAPAVARLRAVMAEFGEGDKPIWHTENGFYTGPVGLSEAEQAARLVRYSIGLLALGIERTFQLTLADWTDDPQHHDPSVYRGLTYADYTKKPAFAAYRTMCQRIADKRFVNAVRPAEGVNGYLFANETESVLVLWAYRDAPRDVTIELGAPVVVVQTLLGETRLERSATGTYTLPLGSEPVYVQAPGAPIRNQQYVRWPDPVQTRLPHSRRGSVEVAVTNPGDRPAVLRLYPHRLASQRFESAAVPPGTTRTLQIAVDATQFAQTSELFWSFDFSDDDGSLAQGFRPVHVDTPIEIAFGPLRTLRADAPVMPVEVRYFGDEPASAEVRLALDGHTTDRRTLALAPGGTATLDLALDLARFRPDTPAGMALVAECGGQAVSHNAARQLIACRPAPGAARVDGALDEWAEQAPHIPPEALSWEYVNAERPPPADDLSVRAWVGYDARGLSLAVQVRDDAISLPRGRNVWDWDSLQVGLDLGADGRPGNGYDGNDLEIEVGRGADGTTWCYLGHCPPGWPQEGLSAKLEAAVQVDEETGTIVYELLVPREALASVALEPDLVLGFSFLVNDNDGDGRAGWLELTPGIGMGKRPAEFAWLWLR